MKPNQKIIGMIALFLAYHQPTILYRWAKPKLRTSRFSQIPGAYLEGECT